MLFCPYTHGALHFLNQLGEIFGSLGVWNAGEKAADVVIRCAWHVARVCYENSELIVGVSKIREQPEGLFMRE